MSNLALGGVLELMGAPAEVGRRSENPRDLGFVLLALVNVSPDLVDGAGCVPAHLVPLVLQETSVELPMVGDIAIVPASPDMGTEEFPVTGRTFAVLGFSAELVQARMTQAGAIEAA